MFFESEFDLNYSEGKIDVKIYGEMFVDKIFLWIFNLFHQFQLKLNPIVTQCYCVTINYYKNVGKIV